MEKEIKYSEEQAKKIVSVWAESLLAVPTDPLHKFDSLEAAIAAALEAARVEGLKRAKQILLASPQSIWRAQSDLLDAEIAALERGKE